MKHDELLVAAIRRMKGEGVRNAEIAQTVGVTVATVLGICNQRGIKKPTAGRLELPLGPRLIQALQAEADRRDEPFTRFMRDLLRKTVEDNLFAAILDDGK